MSRYYLYVLPADATLEMTQTRSTIHHPSVQYLRVDDNIMLVRIGEKFSIFPNVFRIVSANRSAGTITLELVERYNQFVDEESARDMIEADWREENPTS